MAGPAQGNQSDNSAHILWWVAVLFAAIGAIWFGFRAHLIAAYLSLKLLEVKLLTMVTGHHYDALQTMLVTVIANPKIVSFHDLVLLGSAAGAPFRLPLAAILIALGFIVFLTNTTRVFKRTYHMKDLATVEKANWPQISPVTRLDLLKTDIDAGPWAMAMQPMQFCKKHQLLDEVRPERREGMARKEWDRVDVMLRRGDANRVFTLQLGPRWSDTKRLPMHVKALFAVFAARLNSDTKAALKMLEQLSASSNSKLDFSGVDALCKKYENTKLVQQRVIAHAYVMTVMASMLEGAREDGVQASADFLWLKPLDRRLWYILNTVGRQTPFVEIAGIFAHWVAEKEAGKKLVMPMVEEASKALELALTDILYRPDDE
ncbi:MAG: hypothetical protein A3E85_02095 [Gammaproteobacteria bacterium RIFCSPHIGHO2_12_FULL_45_12]|nr:MAG: hypothetical protein A3E85_02095 [Gammaproteobacteria bacterium RIFCSPHIGHO2_12_FULL_45_12]